MTSNEDWRDGRALLARVLAEGGVEGVQILSQESAERALTDSRKELITLLRSENVSSVAELAELANRDKEEVSSDLGVLAEHGIIRYDRQEGAKHPYLVQNHIVTTSANIFEQYPPFEQVLDDHSYRKLSEAYKHIRAHYQGEATISETTQRTGLSHDTILELIDAFAQLRDFGTDESRPVTVMADRVVDDEPEGSDLSEYLRLEEE